MPRLHRRPNRRFVASFPESHARATANETLAWSIMSASEPRETSPSTPYGQEQIDLIADPANWEIWTAPSGQPEVLYQRFPEFTCRCPRSGYPDFATVHLVLIPDQKVLELKHLKLWLNSFRERTISHELATAEIIETLMSELGLRYGFILMEYTPRGNLTTIPMVEKRDPKTHGLPPDDPLAAALENALHVKRRLIDRVIGSV
jgi:7-cyano-7-deazaguanine reductase